MGKQQKARKQEKARHGGGSVEPASKDQRKTHCQRATTGTTLHKMGKQEKARKQEKASHGGGSVEPKSSRTGAKRGGESLLTHARRLRTTATSPKQLEELQEMVQSILQQSQEQSEQWTDTGMLLATLLLQSTTNENQRNQIATLLRERGFRYRLSKEALTQSHRVPSAAPLPHANAWDNVLPPALFDKLSKAFSSESSFWSSHNYSDGSSGQPPSPYFSYIVPLKKSSTVLMSIINILQSQIATTFPEVMDCTAAEWWCHCRPHSSGHQFHFDSDDEGRGGVRNPVASSVLSLTEGIGGETLVTTQTAVATSLMDAGWLCKGRRNRLLAFGGNLLHGVVPGAGVVAPAVSDKRRITFMVAFWKRIRVQDDPNPGAARPFSRVQDKEWAQPLMERYSAPDDCTVQEAKKCFFRVPVWQDVDEQENTKTQESLQYVRKNKLLPPYDSFFQFYT
jgi:hypothetical protein